MYVVGNFFNKEIEFTIVQLAYRLFRVLHHVCLRTQSYYIFLVYLGFTAS